ncbi:hypothetical protein HGRIS_005425 [Hohenbuehelia grisea]|uniref:Uncharacterized protein n=1 Tax=Hohenbuehelia grisea TaxID=104357 RepID=A0ABR3JXP6_9AGAR
MESGISLDAATPPQGSHQRPSSKCVSVDEIAARRDLITLFHSFEHYHPTSHWHPSAGLTHFRLRHQTCELLPWNAFEWKAGYGVGGVELWLFSSLCDNRFTRATPAPLQQRDHVALNRR